MKTRFTVAFSMLAGAALGAAAVQGLHAQAKPPIYYVAEIDVTNPDAYGTEYAPKAQALPVSMKSPGTLSFSARCTRSAKLRKRAALLGTNRSTARPTKSASQNHASSSGDGPSKSGSTSNPATSP